MTRIAGTILYVLACVALTTLFVSCVSQEQASATHALAKAVVDSTDPVGPGGASVTPEEEADIARLAQALKDADGIDWKEVGAGALASLAVVFPALRLIPNRFFLGSKPDADVKRAAGL